MSRYLIVILVAGMMSLPGCARHYGLVEADSALMAACDCIGTFAETSNPGREDAGFIKHYADTTGVKQRVLARAASAGATHVVWLHTYSVAAAAQAYRCPATPPLAAAEPAPEGIWEEDLD